MMAAVAAVVLWFNAHEIDPSGINIPRDDNYVVWLWAPDDSSGSAVVDGQEFKCEPAGKKEGKHAWMKVGEKKLKAGKAEVKLGDKVAAIVLANTDFNPKAAEGDRSVFDQPRGAKDARAEKVRDTDTVFTMPEFKSVAEWEQLAGRIKKRLLISSGLLPLPEKPPLNAHIFGKITHNDYSVERVYFEARPGFLVTGNLYRPAGQGVATPCPGIANPHGHWKEGRLADQPVGSTAARCITFARMGMVAFTYDMIGYNDSLQFEHRWGGLREKLWGIHPFAMQLWSSMRVIDFLQSLPDVDPNNIACTGESGGGTQTFTLMAVEPRVKVAAPVNMISHSMQGGCLCENAPIIRLENSNMEIGACMAPRPLMMISATGDWTRETPRVEYPAVKSIYWLYGADGKVENVHIDAEHNYNKASREAVYRFFGNWVLGQSEKYAHFTEPPYTMEKVADLLVFPDKKLPEGLPKAQEIIDQTIASNKAKWAAILPKNADDAKKFRNQFGDALALTIGTTIPAANDLDCERVGFEERRLKGYVVERWLLHRKAQGDSVPALFYRAYDAKPQDAVLVVHGQGKAALCDPDHAGPGPLVAGLIEQGKAVLAIDAFLLGDHHSPFAVTHRATNGTFADTFMPTDTGYRIQDVLTGLAWLRSRRDLTGTIDLIGLEQGGVWALFAAAIDGKVAKTLVDANQFNPDDDQAWVEKDYIPCIRGIGDVRTAAALLAPKRLFLFNAPASFSDAVAHPYEAAGGAHLTAQAETASPEQLLQVLR